jgi:two-component system response regulator ResD
MMVVHGSQRVAAEAGLCPAGGAADERQRLDYGASRRLRDPLMRNERLQGGGSQGNQGFPCVLVVDDEPIVREVVVRYLRREGFRTLEAADGDAARALLERETPSLVVLDLMLPGTDGLALCRWIRERSDLPVIMLTALGEEADRIVGLELGADDYVTKPFSPRELAVRVKAVLRRASAEPAGRERVRFGDVEVDAAARRATKSGEELTLTAREFDLLWFLASHPGRVFSRAQLMASVWGYEAALDTGTVTVHMRRLREKVEDDPSKPRHLETVWGVGYRFTP